MEPEQQFELLLSESLHLPGNHAPLFATPDASARALPWKVHVDLSASMQGYLRPSDSTLRQLLENIHRERLDGSEIVGEGQTNSTSDLLPVPKAKEDFLLQGQYVRGGINYSNLFDRFRAENNFNHILITDGVLVKDGRLIPPRVVTDAAKKLLSRGGEFAICAVRSRFEGPIQVMRTTGVNEEAGSRSVVCDVDNRPLLLWVFVQPHQSLKAGSESLAAVYRLLGAQRAPPEPSGNPRVGGEIVFHIGNRPLEILVPPSRPLHRVRLANISCFEPSVRSSRPAFRAIEAATFGTWTFAPIPVGKVVGGADRLINLRFELPLDSAELRDRLGAKPDGTPSRDTNVATANQRLIDRIGREIGAELLLLNNAMTNRPTAATTNRQTAVNLLKTMTPRVHWATEAGESSAPEVRTLQLCLHDIPRPSVRQQRQFAWMLTLRTKASEADRERWARFSTDDDGHASNAGGIYGLREFLEALHEDCVVLDRVVFFTDWPE